MKNSKMLIAFCLGIALASTVIAVVLWNKYDKVNRKLTRLEKPEFKPKNPDFTSCKDCSVKETYGHSFADFEDVVDRYRDERWNVINAALVNRQIGGGMINPLRNVDDADARAVWFSLDSLKQFICTIEKYSAKLQAQPDSLGIRMYYAVYNSLKKRFPQRHTIFMVPTFKMRNSAPGITGTDFDPRYLYNNETKVEASTSLLAQRGSLKPALMLTADNQDPQLRANDGDLCPPCSKGCVHGIIDAN